VTVCIDEVEIWHETAYQKVDSRMPDLVPISKQGAREPPKIKNLFKLAVSGTTGGT